MAGIWQTLLRARKKAYLFETKLNKHNSGYRQTGLYHEHFTLVFNGGECHIVKFRYTIVLTFSLLLMNTELTLIHRQKI